MMEGLVYLRNENSSEGAGADELESVAWERSHYSPFTDLYNLHIQMEDRNLSGWPLFPSYDGTHSAKDYVKFYIEVVAIVLVGVPGMVGNILSACVLLNAKMRSPITYLLLGLALTDLLMILNGILAIAVPNFCLFYKINLFRHKFITFLPVIHAVGPTAHHASVLYALSITLERYFAVKHPLKARTICTLFRAKIISIAVILFSIVYSIPKWFEFTYVKIRVVNIDNDEEVEGSSDYSQIVYYYLPVTTDLRKNQTYMKSMYATNFILFYAVPMVIIIYFNVFIYLKVKIAKKAREAMTVSQTTENNMTTMLLLIVVVFILCNSLPVVNLISKIITGNPQIFVIDSIRNFLWILNSSINFLIYYAYSDRFRETCLDIWPICFQNVCFKNSRKKRQLKYSSTMIYSNSNLSSQLSVITVASSLCSIKEKFDDDQQQFKKTEESIDNCRA